MTTHASLCTGYGGLDMATVAGLRIAPAPQQGAKALEILLDTLS